MRNVRRKNRNRAAHFFLFPFSFFLALSSAPAVPSVPAAPTTKSLTIRATPVSEAPNVDGRLAERFWKDVPSLGDFIALPKNAPAEPKTSVQIATARRWLYVAATCETEDIHRVETFRRRRDSDVFNDDSLEVLLDPQEPDGRVYRFVINSIGTRLDEVIPFGGQSAPEPRPFWLGRARRGIAPNINRWMAELAIDLASLDLSPKNTGVWRANFIRHARGVSRSESAWVPARFWLFGCDKERMGTIAGIEGRGLTTGCRLRVASSNVQPAGTLLRGRIAVEIANEAADRRAYDLTLRTPTRWIETRQVALAPNESKTVEFPLEMSLGEEHEIKIEASDPESKLAAAALAHVLTWPAPLRISLDRSYYTNETSASVLAEFLEDPPDKHSLDLRLFNADTGKSVWQPEPSDLTPLAASPDDRFSRIAASIPLSRLPFGGYLVEAVMGDPSAAQRIRVWSALRRMAPRKGEVKIAADGLLLRDGAPFFPVEVRRVEPTTAINAEIKSKAAFNVNWAWLLAYAGTDSYMQNFYKGTGCLGEVNVDYLVFAKDAARDEAILRARRVAASPFLFAYGLESLPGEDGYSTEPAATVRSYLQTLDPHRPFYIALSHPSQIERYRDLADYLVMRCRAIGPGGTGEPQWIYELICRAREQAGPDVPIVAMLSAYRDYEQGLERPTPAQMRAVTYLALIGGAAGVIFDGYHYRNRTDPARRGFSDDPALRDAIYALSRQAAFLGPILLSPDASVGSDLPEVSVEQPPDGTVRWTTRRHAAGLYVVAANASAQKAVAAFQLGQRRGALEVREVFENRAVALDGARFLVEFEPYGTRVFAITAKR